MGNFKIEIEAVGGHGYAREVKQGERIPYDVAHPDEIDAVAKRLVDDFGQKASIVSATLTHWPDSTPIIDDLKNGVRLYRDFTTAWADEAILQFFGYAHLPEKLQTISKPFCHAAFALVATLPRNAERTVALRKLLEAKDAAVRAAIAK